MSPADHRWLAHESVQFFGRGGRDGGVHWMWSRGPTGLAAA